MKKTVFTAAVVAALGMASLAQAAVVAGPTIGGLATFTDTNTGEHWLKLNDFFNTSGDDMIAAATAAGFTVADSAQLHTLLDTLPLSDGQWSGDAAVMGSAPNRELMWAAYGPVTDGYLGWAYAYNGDSGWSFNDGAFPSNSVSNGDGPYADENLWAFSGGGVPEPASWALMLLGVGGMGAALRRARKTAGAAA